MKFRTVLTLVSLLLLSAVLSLIAACRPAVWYDLQPGTAGRVEKPVTVPLSFNYKDSKTGAVTRVEESYPVQPGWYVIQLAHTPAAPATSPSTTPPSTTRPSK
jgi:hypothetical protein